MHRSKEVTPATWRLVDGHSLGRSDQADDGEVGQVEDAGAVHGRLGVYPVVDVATVEADPDTVSSHQPIGVGVDRHHERTVGVPV